MPQHEFGKRVRPETQFGEIVKGHVIYEQADHTIVPGTTTITNQLNKPALPGWSARVTREGYDYRAITEESRRVGTLAHTMVHCHFLGREVDTSEYSPSQIALAENAMIKFFAYLDDHRMQPRLVEVPLVSEKYDYGGTIDCYGDLDGALALADWKTGSGIYTGNKLQAAGYWNLLIENGYPCEEVRVVRIGREETDEYEELRIRNPEQLFALFLLLLRFYYGMREYAGPGAP